MFNLLLFTTEGCHLCEHAEAIIKPLAAEYGFSLTKVEISESDQLMDAYALRIPVVKKEIQTDESDLGWPFSKEQAIEFLAL